MAKSDQAFFVFEAKVPVPAGSMAGQYAVIAKFGDEMETFKAALLAAAPDAEVSDRISVPREEAGKPRKKMQERIDEAVAAARAEDAAKEAAVNNGTSNAPRAQGRREGPHVAA